MPNRDEIKQAAEIEIAVNDPGDRSVYFARALLAYMERQEKMISHIELAGIYFRQLATHPEGYAELDAAIKAAEEGRG